MNSSLSKNPQRMCIACRRFFDKKDLLRIVKSPEGIVSVDTTGKRSGRGAYLCAEEACLRKCEKGILKKNLACDIPPEIFAEIRSVRQK